MKAILVALFAVCALSLAHSNAYYKAQFGAYTAKFNKNYSAQETRYRLSVFSENLDYINAENEKDHAYTLGITPFADMTHDEFKASRICGCMMKKPSRGLRNSATLKEDIPESVNWIEKGAVNAVKDQASCGSCWAFSAVAAMEGVDAIKNGKLQSFSEQQLVDCDNQSEGCNGGLMDYGFEYVINNGGICSEEAYPYTAKDGSCKDKSCTSIASFTSYVDVEENNGKQLLAAIAKNPVSVAIDADSFVFQFYTSGVITSEACGTDLDHGVAAVGYGTESGKKYILVRNSWGSSWGLDGYVKIGHVDDGEGICGINSMASYPLA
ncbi:hypothetical protein WA158_000140 [Blastocystis sp. Blastoise]